MRRVRNDHEMRLHVEVLESRDLMAGDIVSALNAPMSDFSGTLVLPTQMSTVDAAAAFGSPIGMGNLPGVAIVLTNPDPNANSAPALTAPPATTGVGQMTITTGANTPGIGSFATSTLGFASENGGRSGG